MLTDRVDTGCVGEASNPGPSRWRRRLRPLPWSWDSDTKSDGPELTRQARRSEEVFVHSDRGRQVEHDLVGNPEVAATEVDPTVLAPEDGSGHPLASDRAHDRESMRVDVRSDNEVSSTLLDGLQEDLGIASTQFSPTVPGSQGLEG